ncbi:sterol uptake control 2 [Fusarium sp. NRRL 25303]|nr:sterol uptake control 2 [Fusarium sp. NRRL 25303]
MRHPSPTPSIAIESAHAKRHAVRLGGKRHIDKGDKGINTRRKHNGRDGIPRERKHTARKSAVTESHLHQEKAIPLPTPPDIDSLKSIANSDWLFWKGFDYSTPSFLCFSPEQLTFMAHGLRIISHAQTGVVLVNICSDTARFVIIDIAVRNAFNHPYLIDQLLAVSADQLAVLNPDQALDYQRLALEFQTRALTTLNREARGMTQEIAEKDLIPRILHSFFLILHVLYLTFTRDRDTYDLFIQKFVKAVHLSRGLRTLAGLDCSLAVDSPLGPFLAMVHDAGVSEPTGTECTRLVEFIDSSDAGSTTTSSCRDAARKFQWAFDNHAALTGDQRALTAVVYPALLSEEYIIALQKCRLEALVILAHYGILLHLCRHVWVFGDAGEFLIRLIARRLGPCWHEALKWPLEVVASEACSS